MPRDTTYYTEWTNERGTRLRLELIPASMDVLSDPASYTLFPRGSIEVVGEQKSSFPNGIPIGIADGDSLSIVVNTTAMDADLRLYINEPEGTAWTVVYGFNDRKFNYWRFTKRTRGSNLWILYSDRNTGSSPTFVEFAGVQRVAPTTKGTKKDGIVTKSIELIDVFKFAIESIQDLSFIPLFGEDDPYYDYDPSSDGQGVGVLAAPYGRLTFSEYRPVFARDPMGGNVYFAKLDIILARYVFAVSLVLKTLFRNDSTTTTIATNTLPVTFYEQQLISLSSTYEPLYERGAALSQSELSIVIGGATDGLGVMLNPIPERLGGYPSKWDYLKEFLEQFAYKAGRKITKSGSVFAASFYFLPILDAYSGSANTIAVEDGDAIEWEEGDETRAAANATLKASHPDDITETEYRLEGTFSDQEDSYSVHLHNVPPLPSTDRSSTGIIRSLDGSPFYVEGIPDGLIYYNPVSFFWAVHRDTTVDLGGSTTGVTVEQSTIPDAATTKSLAGIRGYVTALQQGETLPYAIAKTVCDRFSSRGQLGQEKKLQISTTLFPYALGDAFTIPVPDSQLTKSTTEGVLVELVVDWRSGEASAKFITIGT